MNLIFKKEGHYSDGENDFMSIWTYKKANGIASSNEQNYQEAKAIDCADKYWKAFNQSNLFIKGWIYNTVCLDAFYKSQY